MLDRLAIEAMKQSLKGGVQTISAPSLFPTPHHLAIDMVRRLDLYDADRVLEPSAGTGNILRACKVGQITAIEIDARLATSLVNNFPHVNVFCYDFLNVDPDDTDWKPFDKIIMNPPFERGQDVDHVMHAYKFLRPGGRLVSVMCEGPFFRSDKKSVAFRQWLNWNESEVEKLPADTFKDSGTRVNTRLVIIDKQKSIA